MARYTTYPADYVKCRSRRTHGHKWDDYYPLSDEFRPPEFGTRVCMHCERCDTVKHRLVSRDTGEALTPWQYVHPDDYRPEDIWTADDYAIAAIEEHLAGARNGRRKKSDH